MKIKRGYRWRVGNRLGGREGVPGEEQQRTVLDEYGRWGRGRGVRGDELQRLVLDEYGTWYKADARCSPGSGN